MRSSPGARLVAQTPGTLRSGDVPVSRTGGTLGQQLSRRPEAGVEPQRGLGGSRHRRYQCDLGSVTPVPGRQPPEFAIALSSAHRRILLLHRTCNKDRPAGPVLERRCACWSKTPHFGTSRARSNGCGWSGTAGGDVERWTRRAVLVPRRPAGSPRPGSDGGQSRHSYVGDIRNAIYASGLLCSRWMSPLLESLRTSRENALIVARSRTSGRSDSALRNLSSAGAPESKRRFHLNVVFSEPGAPTGLSDERRSTATDRLRRHPAAAL